jgi:catechol 2,3-dioxygenase-like lactoylglutathione lyase family enzyme
LRRRRGRETAVSAVLDHTIVQAHDHEGSAAFMAQILGLPAPVTLGPFAVVRAGDVTTLDFIEVDGPVTSQHYAFLVTEAEFDEIFARIRQRAIPYFADPHERARDVINTWDGGRGLYFEDPNGHLLEIITRPYGTGGSTTDNPHPLAGGRG